MATVGTVEVIATIDTSRYKKGAQEIERTNSNIEGSTQKTSSKMNGAFNTVAKVGIGALVAATVAAGAAITKNIGGAIERIDTLVAFPRVLQALGVSSEEAESATEKLAESLRGLPTALGAGAKGVQGFVTSGLDVDKATRAFLGFNNAMLAAGVETAAAQSTMQQLNQALSRGRIDGAEWNSIAANIPTVLQALQNETGKSKDELRELFREDPQALIDNIIRLNEEGGGGLASLEDQARNATGGIGTAFANLNNAIQRGIQNIVESIGGGDLEAGQKKISDFISNVGTAFGDALVAIGGGLKIASDAINLVIELLQPLIKYVKENQTIMNVLKTTLIAIGGILLGAVLAGIVVVVGAVTLLTLTVQFLVDMFTFFMEVGIATWQAISKFAVDAWKTISSTFSNVGKWFTDKFNAARDGVMRAFASLPGFFRGIWNSIISIFGRVGVAIGNAIGGAVKGVVNSILGFAENTINGFIRAINTALGAINKIPGVNIGRLGLLNIPRLAEGGIVPATPGGILANIGEGGEAEAVIPLSKLDKMIKGDTTNTDNSKIEINVSGVFATSKQEQRNVAELIAARLKEVQKSRALGGGAI